MLAPLRRCPASLPRALSTVAATRSALRSTSLVSPHAVFSSARIAPLLSIRAFQSSVRLAGVEAAATEASQPVEASTPITKFRELQDRGIIHPNVIQAIVKDMGLETMTDVQSATINQAIHGTDM